MWDIFQDILVNVLFILFPTLFYHVFLREDDYISRKKVTSKFFITLAVSMLLTMTFPAIYAVGFSYDLRIIPIILAFIYCGIFPGTILVGIMLVYASVLGSDEFLLTLANYLVVILLLNLLSKKLYQHFKRYKYICISLFFLAITISRFVFLFSEGEGEQIPFTILLAIIKLITILSVVALIENIKKQLTMQRQLEHIEKMNAISQLAASVAHEVRNPMTTVRGFLQILSRNEHLPVSDKSFITISIEELDRAQTIINEYLALSKPQKSPFEKLDFTKVINDSIKVISTYATINNIEIATTIEDSLKVKGYKNEIQQVLINLMKNGVEAMEGSGTLEVIAEQKSNYIEIKIRDTGSGITKQQLKQLGTPYYSTKDKGTGLGLMVSFEIIKRMAGKIGIESEVGEGTTFTILLPAA
ncbi:ATP-binding protein [Alkalihalobacillus sp. AL-G]|uniref:ATP-binding protein n=1 Tax=Alkalihalobacillus sp. AL-G TaxID=2926399 RepID=UPI00272A8251|nr:ATP-binding protein [Alkalihalobacillus sp. AL-G]WLD93289.1 ATP-binding protein [Alkalihalobacillus sp. AL-G]